MSNWMRRGLAALVGAAAIATAVFWLSGGCEERIPPGETPRARTLQSPEDRFSPVAQVDGVVVEWASGTLVSARRTTVASRILARIEEVRVRAGSEVARGDVLIVFDARDLEARVREAAEAANAARARLTLARSDEDRLSRLFEEGVVTRQQLDRAASDLQFTTAEVERLERRLEEAQAGQSYSVIRSPVSGRVVDRLAEPGDTPMPGQALLRIYDPSVLRGEVPVRETLAVRLVLGQPLRVEVPAIGETLEGIIDEIVPFAEAASRTLLVKVRLPPHENLYAGMFARIEIPAGKRTRLLLPAAAVESIGQLQFVDVLSDEDQLERRLVTTAESHDAGTVEVLSGLVAGERVRLPVSPSVEEAVPE